MSIKYDYSESLQVLAEDISRRLFPYVLTSRIKCFRSLDSGSKLLARCHSLSKIMQDAMDSKPLYCLEFVRENFDDLSTEKKVKVVIRQLINISRKFDGSFNSREFVKEVNIGLAYNNYLECRKNDSRMDFFKELKD